MTVIWLGINMSKNGFSLVELLIALALSLTTILMMTMLFKQVGRVGILATQDAEFDLQLETGILVAQKLLQGAGYGTGNLGDIKEGSFSEQPAIFWRLRPDLEVEPIELKCQGLTETVEQDQNMYVHRLLLLSSPSCSASEDLNNLTWNIDNVLTKILSGHKESIFDFELKSELGLESRCNPFGIKEIEGSRKVIITVNNKNITEGLGRVVQRAVCLNNIQPM